MNVYQAIAATVCGDEPRFRCETGTLLDIAAALVTSLAEATNEDPLRILQQLEEVSLP